MKKIILSLSLLALTIQASAQTQIGNSNFEAWETSTSELAEPVNWNSFKTASGTFSSFSGKQMNKSTSVRPGSTGNFSVRIWTRDASLALANGNMTCGQIVMGNTSPTSSSNHNKTVLGDANFSENFTATTPDSLVVWVKYKPINTTAHTARVSCAIHTNAAYRDPNDLGSTTLTKAVAQLNFPYSGGNWQRLSIPFSNVNASLTSAYIITTFTSCSVAGGGSENDTLYVDDMELIYVPKAAFTSTATTICAGSDVTFTNTSTSYPTSYSWNFGDGTPAGTVANPVHTYAAAGTYTATLTVTNQWGSTTSTPVTITVNAQQDATFSYSQATYCSNAGSQTPTVVDAGTFSSTAGLSINATTGVINLATSTAGTYTVTNTISGACPDTKTTSITINQASDASFNYPSNTICISDGNQTPTTAAAGTFSSTAGLVFVSTITGEIDVVGSTAGTYTITYNVGGTCPDMTQTSVTLTSIPDASFTYAQGSYCADALNPAPVFGAGASAGAFSALPSGLTINTNSGAIDLSASTAGSYVVTNNIAAVGSCPASSETFTVVVNALPVVTLGTFQQVCVYNPAFSLTGGAPAGGTYSGSGVSTGSFNPATAGLGTQTVTYSYTDATTTCSNTATNTIVVDACLGVEDNTLTTVSVYPNPTDGKLTISNLAQNASYKVVSTSGQVVLTGTVSNSSNTIDLSMVENGIYVLQFTQEQSVQTVRIVKK
jgi:PKD repeat protein